ncbi:hypothetical protein FVEN_g915 [Fusarium venenatum]|uniref:Zn(2)-C6 fungal-type domain-containing protein n=1 Tax=Fusarium venenatum TaxID=56646 RepID=A0A2L2U594_9HYPO|nr:uncharacterized protein FVRRES_10672 [Fusarium venenatum]KAG8361545.1 hypothetical protein FVEN_g915 [Fusarium venenatum]KAH6967260.1 hypothetical protein EDB82DRAFT_518218 [Fusarium venenatum]CEI70595.1 unnamed protein product [Fusarium venenatum]
MSDAEDDASALRKGAKLRRGHKKVKTGCTDCRRRRVKCTEEKPKCRACQRRGAECEYPFSQAGSLSVDHPSHSPASHASFGPSPRPRHFSPLPGLAAILREQPSDQATTEFGIRDMALLHHWTISTCHDIYKNSALSLTFQHTFPQIAFKHPFVMRLLLGLSALHLAYLQPNERLRHVGEASRYHNQSLKGFNETIKLPPEEVSDALFAWSSLNALYVFGIQGRLGHDLWDDSERISRKDRILGLSWVPMLRGVQTMIDPCFYELRDGPLRDLLTIGNFDELDLNQHSHPADQHFCRTREVWKSNPDEQTYEDTLQVLRRCHMFMEQFSSMEIESPGESIFNRSWQGAFLLVPFAPEAYFTLLQQRQPPALILYAFYGALLHRFMHDTWFMEGWGQDIVEVVTDLLGSYWREWIAWPLQVVGTTS